MRWSPSSPRAAPTSRRERDVPPPRNQGQLSVLTLHGSKGLEFPHVILIDLGKKPQGVGCAAACSGIARRALISAHRDERWANGIKKIRSKPLGARRKAKESGGEQARVLCRADSRAGAPGVGVPRA